MINFGLADCNLIKRRPVKADNRGFSLVELLVCVTILAIAAIPIAKSMSTAGRINGKAQSIQNATSLGEKIMEEVKSSSISELRTKYGFTTETGGTTPYYEIGLSDVTATQGEQFDVVVKIDSASYQSTSSGSSALSDIVKQVNSTKLPVIEEIDTLSQAVLTSKKEFNKYDFAAQSYFNEQNDMFDALDTTTYATITDKTIDIVKENLSGVYDGVKITCTVTYDGNWPDSATGGTKSGTFVRELYTGSFTKGGASPGGSSSSSSADYLDSNIYMFYQKNAATGAPNPDVTINIYDTYSQSAPDPTDSHRVYFIRQDSDATGPTVNFYDSTTTPSLLYTFTYGNTDLDDGNKIINSHIKLISNLGTSGKIYETEARARIYDISVTLTSKSTGAVTTLTSTKSVNDKYSSSSSTI